MRSCWRGLWYWPLGQSLIIVCPQDSVEAFKKCGNVVGLHVYEDLDTAMELPLSLGVVAFTKDKAKAPARQSAGG